MMKSPKTVSLVLLFLIIAFVLLISFYFVPIEGFDGPVVIQGGVSLEPTISGADVESNNLIHSSPNEDYRKQYVLDKAAGTLTENEYDMKIIAVKPPTKPPIVYATSPVILPSYNPNLNFSMDLSGWAVTYFPDSIIGVYGIGLTPTITVKNGTDSYGFTFPKNYLQIQFTGFSQYKFPSTPFVTLQTKLILNPGYYTLNYNIQTRPGLPIEDEKPDDGTSGGLRRNADELPKAGSRSLKDARTIAIMAMANTEANVPFLFSRPGVNGGPRTAVLSDEKKLTAQSLKFYISKADGMNPVTLSFVFIVSDPTITDNCTVAIGDIEVLNCQYNACP